MDKRHYVYLLRCADGSLYTGMTPDIADPACLPDLCPALAGADIRPVPDAKLADHLPDMTNPADA